MRPGMRFRGRIEIARVPGVLQVPLAAVVSTAAGAHRAQARGPLGPAGAGDPGPAQPRDGRDQGRAAGRATGCCCAARRTAAARTAPACAWGPRETARPRCRRPLLVACWRCAGCGRRPGPRRSRWSTVKKQKFARVVEADGYLRPVRATPVTVPARRRHAPAHHLAGRRRQPRSRRARWWPASTTSSCGPGWPTASPTGRWPPPSRPRRRCCSTPPSRDRGPHHRGRRPRAVDDPLVPAPRHAPSSRATRSSRARSTSSCRRPRSSTPARARRIDRRLGGNKLALIAVEARKAEEAIRRANKGLTALEMREPPRRRLHPQARLDGRDPAGGRHRLARHEHGRAVPRWRRWRRSCSCWRWRRPGWPAGGGPRWSSRPSPTGSIPAKVKQVETVAKRRAAEVAHPVLRGGAHPREDRPGAR